jgi:hypothetical protein
MTGMKDGLLLPLRQDEYALNKKNGYILSDCLIAVVLGVTLFVPALVLLSKTIVTYQTARGIQAMAMYGRLGMEEMRSLDDGQTFFEKRFEQHGNIYDIKGYCRSVDDTYCLHEIWVRCPDEQEYRFKRLERRKNTK